MNLSVSSHPIVRVLVSRLRNRDTDSATFRHIVTELTTLLIVEALADLSLVDEPLLTPLGPTTGARPACPIVFVPILRAGLGMAEASARLLPEAPICHLGLYRDEETLQPVTYYDRVPHHGLEQAITVLLDPMLATAGTATAAIDVVRRHGAADIRFVGLIGAPEGVAALTEAHPDTRIFLAALDERLTTSDDPFPPGYIWPGLGDAGDRQFGTR
jgi:uracil phosphoribosyltransferase